MGDYSREEYQRGRDARIRSETLTHHMSEQLRINKYKRMVKALRELHEKQEAERVALGLPPPPPPVAKSTKGERSRTKKPEAPPPKPERTSSAPRQRTAHANAELERTMRASAYFAHDRVNKWQEDALAKATKAQTAATQAAAEVVAARTALANEYTDEGEKALRAKSEAAIKAEAEARTLNAHASKFNGVVPRARAKFTEELTKSRNEIYANHERRENKNFISKWGGQIFSLGTDHKNEALKKNLTTLADNWSYIARVGRYLEDSVKHISVENISNENIKTIANLLGKALHKLENTSGDNDVEADRIIVLINEAKSIKTASDEAQKLRNKAGFKRTKKHRKKRRKTRNNITNKFVARKH